MNAHSEINTDYRPMDRPAKPGVLIVGGAIGSLAAARSLGRHGVRVWYLTDGYPLPGLSRYVARTLTWDGAHNDAAAEELVALARQHGLDGWLLIPGGDPEVRLIARNHPSSGLVTAPPATSLTAIAIATASSAVCVQPAVTSVDPIVSYLYTRRHSVPPSPSCRELHPVRGAIPVTASCPETPAIAQNEVRAARLKVTEGSTTESELIVPSTSTISVSAAAVREMAVPPLTAVLLTVTVTVCAPVGILVPKK